MYELADVEAVATLANTQERREALRKRHRALGELFLALRADVGLETKGLTPRTMLTGVLLDALDPRYEIVFGLKQPQSFRLAGEHEQTPRPTQEGGAIDSP